jgi:NADH:ubiquinone oxidoreductase subunit E
MNNDINNIVDQIVEEKGKKPDAVIPVLQAIQDKFNYLPQEALKRVCEISEITQSQITGISTFYSQFRHHPAGKHIVKVCVGTACHVKGAVLVHDTFKRELNIPEKEDTDAEKLFTIEKVACLGCCTIAPVVQIDEVTYGNVETDKVKEIIEDFKNAKDKPNEQLVKSFKTSKSQGEIRVGLGSCCIASGSYDVKQEIEKTLTKNNIDVNVKQVGCVGVCNQVPLLEIHKPDEEPVFYAKIKPEDVKKVIHKHFKATNFFDRIKNDFFSAVDNMLVKDAPETINRYPANKRDTPISEFLDGQIYISTEHRGILKPSDLNEYKSLGGFEGLKKCLECSPQEIIDIIKESGLRGRGGGGFLSGIKWQLVKDANAKNKYIICNGDEGDPGAFMDRMLLESYPHQIIEGLIIAAYAVGAKEGILYIRAEYPLAVIRIKEAIEIAEKEGIIGKNILGSEFSFKLAVFEGAGAFVCGEETALIASIEGKRGLPSMRPPYPAEKGLWGKPTLINNTETFSLVPWIVRNGAMAFNKIGTEKQQRL